MEWSIVQEQITSSVHINCDISCETYSPAIISDKLSYKKGGLWTLGLGMGLGL